MFLLGLWRPATGDVMSSHSPRVQTARFTLTRSAGFDHREVQVLLQERGVHRPVPDQVEDVRSPGRQAGRTPQKKGVVYFFR